MKKLDGELGRYKDQMSKLRNGPGKVCHPTSQSRAPKSEPHSLGQDAIQQRALRTLKQKRMYESQLAQLTQQTFNMESAALTTENLRNTMATVDALQASNKEIKKQYGKINLDKIEVRYLCSLVVPPLIVWDRIYTMKWRIYSNRLTRSKNLLGVLMRYLTRLTRRTWKPVS